MNAQAIITLIEQLVEFLLELRKNGQLTDEQLDAAVASTNEETRAIIKAYLAQ